MTDEQNKKIEWMNRAFHIEKEANALIAKYKHDESFAERNTRSLSGVGGKTPGNSTEDALVQLAETGIEKDAKISELTCIRREIKSAINTVDDADMRTILTRHFLNYETFDIVAKNMNYGRTTVMRKYKEAIEKLVLNGTP